jgi:hypothetical protein
MMWRKVEKLQEMALSGQDKPGRPRKFPKSADGLHPALLG